MLNKKTFLKLMVAVAAVFSVSVTTAYAQQDYSRAYQFGGVLRAPDSGGGFGNGSGTTQRPILEVGSSFDAGGVLGCSGLDISGMLENTFNVGNLGDEFKNYLQNTIATEALSLLYSQPGVSQVLDGMKAIGHARVSIQQERCNANEIFADVTKQRMRDEGQSLCLERNNGDQTACSGTKLTEYIEEVAQSRRWSGTLHDHVCNEDNKALCKFLPNFAYDVGTGEGQSTQASLPASAVSYAAESAATQCMEVRGTQARAIIDEVGYARGMGLTASGERTISCASGAGGGGGDEPGAGGGDGDGDGDEPGAGGSTSDPLAGFGSVNECLVQVGEEEINVENLANALRGENSQEGMDEIANLNPMELVQRHSECIVGKEIHPHVDLNIQMLPKEQIAGAMRAIAQSVKAKASINLYNALITALSQVLVNAGNPESSGENTINPHTREFIVAQLEAFKAAVDSIKLDAEMTKGISQVVSAVNETRQELSDRATGGINRALARGGRAVGSARQTANIE